MVAYSDNEFCVMIVSLNARIVLSAALVTRRDSSAKKVFRGHRNY